MSDYNYGEFAIAQNVLQKAYAKTNRILCFNDKVPYCSGQKIKNRKDQHIRLPFEVTSTKISHHMAQNSDFEN